MLDLACALPYWMRGAKRTGIAAPAILIAVVGVACLEQPQPSSRVPMTPAPGEQPRAATDPAPRSVPESAAVPEPPAPRPRPEEYLSAEMSASPAAAKLVDLICDIKDNLVETRYQHSTRVRRKAGYYAWDCSGMVDWMLAHTAPRARKAMHSSRPRAIDFYQVIVAAPIERARRGWQRLGHVSEARPGDLFAFPRSSVSRSPVTGHVGIFVEQPWPVAGFEDAWAARILDATRTPHQDDTRADDGIGGFGFGTMMFVNDGDGRTIAYGWHGTDSRGYLPTHVVYGRVLR